MKKISFKRLYECKKCERKIVGYVGKCPLCNGEVAKTKEEKIVTLIKRK